MAYLLHLPTINRLVRTRQDHFCCGARDTAKEEYFGQQRQVWGVGLLARKEGN